MAASSGNKGGAGKKSTNSRSKTTASQTRKRQSPANGNRKKQQSQKNEFSVYNEVLLILVFAAVIFLFLCTVGLIGAKEAEPPKLGDYVQAGMLGLFGITAYILPLVTFFGIAFGISNHNSTIACVKLISLGVLMIIVGMVAQMIGVKDLETYVGAKEWAKTFYQMQTGGGVVFGAPALFCYSFLGKVGTVFVVIVLSIICLVLLTGKSFFEGIKNGSKKIYETTAEGSDKLREKASRLREEDAIRQAEREEELRRQQEQEEDEKLLRMDKKKVGVSMNTLLGEPKTKQEDNSPQPKEEIKHRPSETETVKEQPETNDIHQIEISQYETKEDEPIRSSVQTADWYSSSPGESTQIEEPTVENIALVNRTKNKTNKQQKVENKSESDETLPEVVMPTHVKPVARIPKEVKEESPKRKNYVFPPLSLLGKGEKSNNQTDGRRLKETALKLEKTLETFGVKVKVTDYSQGPAVTRYELHPDQGVKVSKIVSLADDIKLNLAASDIRIEAPIPGKTAVGIEVPNESSMAVPLRDMLEINEFSSFPSNLAFAVGKDIGGKPIVADIAKMPHLLIAGATGSGKSVCINTLIMSILYKAHPDDVKMIMIDPKVVELSVYNGIPHLMIPVVTDPRQASAALQWGVNEMTDRYKKFADQGVRDLKGYNQKAEQTKNTEDGALTKMPQVVIIVDELADLMMACSKEVEESICRLAQLARAAGIHLIIATQRPSVDVITGLIKTNMPSRIAFSVSSGLDSRIILDENGAEKLLGKGDMLFFPQGYTKPARIQGAFVSDKEVSDVVNYIKNQAIGNVYDKSVEEKMLTSGSVGVTSGGFTGGDERDEYFSDAGRFMIEKQKGSIGMLQRFFRIGFNRAARIMDQLEDAGVVSADEGTKPRKILMTLDEFEGYLNGEPKES